MVQEKVRAASCTVHITNPAPFNGSYASCGEGSGTLVDRTLGIILTNKHVMGEGPSDGYVVFDHKEYHLDPLYTDPIHDFSLVKVLTDDGDVPTDLPEEISLHPDQAHPGCEVQIVGNTSGMKSNVGQGFIGRTDANAPNTENRDFNIEYITVTMNAAGGSSGSLAVNIDGEGVALHKSSNGNVSHMLPLDLPLKALRCLRRKTMVKRGTLQTKWVLKQLNECKRLGLGKKWLIRLKEHEVTFAVCAEVVLPEGPADGKVETGDILLELNGELVTSLLQVERHMDAHVEESVVLTCWTVRGLRHVECDIEDLHALTPHHLVGRQGAVFHTVCFATAIHNNIAARGIFTACGAQRAFAGNHIIKLIDGKRITTLEQLIHEIDDKRHGGFITTVHKGLTHHGQSFPTTGYQIRAIGNVSFEMKKQPQQGGHWVTTYMKPPTSVISSRLRPCLRDPLQRGQLCGAAANEISVPDTDTPPTVKDAYRAIISFEAHRDIFSNSRFISKIAGHGLIWDAKAGFVLTARGELTMVDEIVMTVAGTTDVKARVDFLHPALDLAVLKFDPADIPEGLLHDCTLAAMENPIQPGNLIYYVPFDLFNKTIARTRVETIAEAHQLPRDNTPMSAFIPFSHMTCRLRNQPGPKQEDGVLLNEQGVVTGLMVADGHCIPSDTLLATVEHVRAGRTADMRFRDFDVRRIALADAFRQGLDRKWLKQIVDKYVLTVYRVPEKYQFPNGDFLQHPLRIGDIILRVGDNLVTQGCKLGYQYHDTSLRVLFVRGDEEIEADVRTLSIQDVTVNQIIRFCGGWLQKPSLAARMALHPVYSEVFVSGYALGCPADMYKLDVGSFITEINGHKVSTIPDFLEHVAQIPFGEYFRVKLVLENHLQDVITLKKSNLYPTIFWHRPLASVDYQLQVEVVDNKVWQASLPRGCAIVTDSGPAQPHNGGDTA